jgi:hypothetical protein
VVKKEPLARQMALRLAEADLERLEALARRIPIASRNGIARAALRLGLGLLEEDPARVIEKDRQQKGKRKR